MSSLSLNQIVKRITAYAESHGQLSTVMFKPPVDSLDEGDIKYSAFLFDLDRMRKEQNQLVFRFTGWVLDMMPKEATNETEVWSDTALIACDLLAVMDGDEDFELEENIDLDNLTREQGDNLAGVKFQFTIRVAFPYDRCLVPEKSAASDGFLMSEDGHYITTEDGRKIKIDTASGMLVYAESGDPLVTEDGQNIILE